MQSPVFLLSAAAAVVAMWFIWSLGIRKLLLDLMRERLFEVRFELFRLGLSGELPFDSEAYRSIEMLICGLLRFGHRIMFTTYLVSLVETEKAKKEKDYVDVSQQIALKVSRLNPETQVKVLQILQRSHSAFMRYMALSSLFFLAIACVFALLRLLQLWDPDKAEAEVTRVIEREAYLAESRHGARLALA